MRRVYSGARRVHGLDALVGEGSGGATAVGGPGVAPVGQRVHGGPQLFAARGHGVDRAAGVGGPHDQSRPLEFGQPFRQAGQRGGEQSLPATIPGG
jgi:hypothetical protein